MRAGRVGTTEIIFNDYFLLLLGLYFLMGVLPQALMLFAAVAWHESCHALAASRLGWQVQGIELFPFGGVARLLRPPGRDSRDEALIALAGPAASLLLALGIYVASFFASLTPAWLLFFRQVNLILGLFNLWPGLPLDGGRVYRALRSKYAGIYRATVEGVYGGKALAFLLGAGSIAGFIFKMVDLQGLALALFIYCIARQEGEMAPYMFWQEFWRQRGKKKDGEVRSKTGRVSWLAAGPELTLARAVRSFSPNAFNLVAVIGKGGRLEGILTETEIIQELLEGGDNSLEALLRR
ncbi:M50 family metallopeptidase [Moorella sulfitireducens]|uniref:M50 family metallopeptidase n=1 Tax=Neomoorella sulfitireducens TaxID=2972948 RepID=UPI0021AC9678|nr:M50 family metallopeptidase [Moorella sulfitireducens]